MSNEEILQKAIEKSIKNGFFLDFVKTSPISNEDIVFYVETTQWPCVIFSHDFAKAFFKLSAKNISDRNTSMKRHGMRTGSGTVYIHTDKPQWMDWQYHLQQMVISEDPIKYLESYL